MIEGAQYLDGKVVLRYFQPIPKMVVIHGKAYMVNVQYGVPLLFADEEDAPELLETLGGCCNQKTKVFSLASEIALKVWREGSY